MKSLSQREMRNQSGELLRRVADGESILVTNGGVPAAVMVPATAGARARLVAAGRLRQGTGPDLAALCPAVPGSASCEDLLRDDRG